MSIIRTNPTPAFIGNQTLMMTILQNFAIRVIQNRIIKFGKRCVTMISLTIDIMVEGGPAFRCKQLDHGDVILKVDGEDVTLESCPQALIIST